MITFSYAKPTSFCKHFQMSDEGRGVPCISDMLTITFHNSIVAAGVRREGKSGEKRNLLKITVALYS